jgi:hypothetical protein
MGVLLMGVLLIGVYLRGFHIFLIPPLSARPILPNDWLVSG